MTTYTEFLAARAQLADAGGFEPVGLPGHLFDFQRSLVEWSVRCKHHSWESPEREHFWQAVNDKLAHQGKPPEHHPQWARGPRR